ncbi:hypothetical protein [Streptomyces paludis]|uniref:Uncharacterized protein n=1 Tax=Streptomyces paludis TaxID=2282738 RepID=A0A345HRX5_9ACTN|nr:hypothetical protein [Streptomyces paludis]AXG79449.1 hypothetical protein DVK44_19335 [Streptomyces paludis]
MDDSPTHGPSLEPALHAARALVLADLAAGDVARADVVSLVEDSVSHRRWWVEQWPEGVAYVTGLIAQDVQDALLERYGRWPLCPLCDGVPDVRSARDVTDDADDADGEEGGPHALEVEPELGEDPHWICGKKGVVVAPVGSLAPQKPAGGPGGTGLL